jgi:hypothetical protein
MSCVDTRNAGLRFGHLTVAYSIRNGCDIAVCSKLVHVSFADLVADHIMRLSAGPPEFLEQHIEMRAQLRREINFSIARGR